MTEAVSVKTFVEYMSPGIFMSEKYVSLVGSRDPRRDAGNAGRNVFAFRYYDLAETEAEVNGSPVVLTSRQINNSGTYYINAQRLTRDDVRKLPGDHTILLKNMESNGWDAVWWCRTGNFQPCLDDDALVDVPEIRSSS